jgi:hypothetical protein
MRIAILLLAVACAKPATAPASGGQRIRKLEALGLLMKNEINPSFSKVVFLLNHSETIAEDPKLVRAELKQNVTTLRGAIGKLRAWQEPPTETTEGRDVFLTFASSVDQMTDKLVEAIDRGDNSTATTTLEKIADACNNCHHFFRLDIEDSKVTRSPRPADPVHGFIQN